MALQVWLPLTKDLRNQGLGSVRTTNNTNFILKSGGKLGTSCLDLSKTVRLYSPNLVNLKTFSFAFWYRPETSESTINWNDVIGFNDSKGGLFRLETSYSNSYMLSMHNNTQYGIIQNVAASYGNTLLLSSASYSRDVWYHIAVTVEEDDNVKAYVNGELKCIVARSDGSITGYFNLGELGGNNKEDGSLNDLRIYDHCLSPMEVKKLSQGLILHYPLNRQGWGQENLVHNSNQFRVGGHATGVTPSVEEDGTYKVIAESGNSNYSSSWWKETTGIEDEFVEGESFTVSFWIKSSNANKTNPPTIYLKNGMGYYSMKGAVSANYSQVYYTGIWKKANSLAPHLGWSGLVGTYYICQWKIEKGSIPTSWCPNSSDVLAATMGLNSDIEYDTSGYCNNGTWHGTHTNTSDTPKYAVSTTATGSASTYLEGPILPAEAQTAALWIKCKKSQNAAIFNDKTTGLQIGLLNSILYTNSKTSTAGFTTTHWKDDDWNHVVVTYDGTTRKAYINGEAETQSGASNYYIHNADNCWLWNRSYNNSYPFNGSLSDFRIYATALSPTDVKSLYQNCATIDPDGTIRGQIRS